MVEAKLRLSGADRRIALADWLTVERVAYAGLAVLALGIRLWGLGWTPLGPAEASQALPAWAAATGGDVALASVSPLLFTLQRLLFTPLAATDALARWWPALFGGLAVLLFFGLRHRLGRGGALMAALLWAISPMAVFTGRLAVGQALVAPLALAVLVGLSRAMQRSGVEPSGGLRQATKPAEASTPDHTNARSAGLFAAIALGLLLSSGPGAYTALLIGVAAAILWRADWPGFWQTVKAQRWGVVLGGLLTLALGATCFLMTPAGLAAAAELPGAWLRGLAPGAGEYGAWDILRRLLLSEPLLLGFGVAGLVTALRRRDRFGVFAGIAAGIALLVPLIGSGRQPADLALAALALSLLAGPAVAAILRTAWSWRGELDPWLLVSLSLALLTSAVICLASAPNAANRLDWQQLYTAVGIATAVLTVLLWTVYGIWGSWRTVGRALPVAPLVFLLAWGIGQMSGLSYDRDPGRRAAALNETPAANWVEFDAELLAATSLRGSGGGAEGKIDLLLPATGRDPLTPMLRWGLRKYANVRVITSLPADPAAVVITDAQNYPTLTEHYTGADFTLLQRWRPESLSGYYPWLRWILYREAKTPAEDRKIVLWVDRTKK
jgi:hypothetical protein